MNVPRVLRKEVAFLRAHGFKPVSFEPRKGSHHMVVFAGVPGKMVLSPKGDPRAMKNTLADLRRRIRTGCAPMR